MRRAYTWYTRRNRRLKLIISIFSRIRRNKWWYCFFHASRVTTRACRHAGVDISRKFKEEKKNGWHFSDHIKYQVRYIFHCYRRILWLKKKFKRESFYLCDRNFQSKTRQLLIIYPRISLFTMTIRLRLFEFYAPCLLFLHTPTRVFVKRNITRPQPGGIAETMREMMIARRER